MILTGCSVKTKIISDACLWLRPYPNLKAEQYIKIRDIAPNLITWTRDYVEEYNIKCKE